MNYINQYSWKSFISSSTKNVIQDNGLYHWYSIKKHRQLVKDHPLTDADLPLLQSLLPFNFFYFSQQDLDLLAKIGQVSKSKDPDIIIPVKNLSLSGKSYSDIRTAINKNSKKNFIIQSSLNDHSDVVNMLKKWSDTSGDKYFQDRSAKNKHFFKQNWHQDCLNTFVYDGLDLIAFAVLSPPIDGYSSYIIGKALCLIYPGLSEFTDILAYQQAAKNGTEFVNLGGGSKALRNYKLKFPGAFANPTYDGSICSSTKSTPSITNP